MLTAEEARHRRALIEELYSKHLWENARGKVEELAAHIQLCIDRSIVPPLRDVAELCEIVLRTEADARSQSWDSVEAEIRRLVKEAAIAEVRERG